SNLDAKLRVQMRHEIRDLQRRLSITTIYVTHDQEEAMAVSDRIAVMNQGSVVQDGTAEDLYHHPATEFVAQFVGRVNLIEGVVQGINGRLATIAALGRAIVARSGPPNLVAGDSVQIALRPEAIEIAQTSGAGSLQATVLSSVFLGDKVEYLVRCGDETLQVARYNAGPTTPLAAGTAVALSFSEDAVVVLRESKEGSA
ncbi:MAG TPA: ABC transporter ATP-binding protein, partial [Casimicrobiaceae bacterium]